MWEGAERVISSVFTNKYTAVKSGHSLSKDWSAGLIVLQWLFTFQPSKVILTAPTGRQVQKIMFGEIRKHFDRRLESLPWKLSRDVLMTNELRLSHDWFALGFTTKEGKDAGGGKFQGYKSQNLLVIVTEAQEIEDIIYDQIEGITTSSNSRVLEIANPLLTRGRFWEHCTTPKWGYNVITLNALTSPNYLARKEVIPGLISYEKVERWREIWGEDNPFWYARVLGEFPQASSKALIPLEWIMRARDRDIPDNDLLKAAGHDVAGDGTAETVMVVLEGRRVKRIEAFHKMSIAEQVRWAKSIIREEKIELYAVDEGGLAGVSSFLEEERLSALRVKFGENADNEDFKNRAAEMWWELRKAFERDEISILDDEILIGQLAAREFEFTSTGKRSIAIEPKGEAAKRGHHHFDRADALVLAWWARTRRMSETVGKSDEFVSEAAKTHGKYDRPSNDRERKAEEEAISGQDACTLEADDIKY